MEKGLILTIIGMTWVVTFLLLMIILMSISSKLILKFFPQERDSLEEPEKRVNDVDKIAAAIAIASHHKKESS